MAGSRGEERRQQPSVITNARQGSSREFEVRRRNYMIAMGARTVCFLLSTILFFTHVINGWVCAILFAAAVVLPSVAVAAANQSNTRIEDQAKFETGAPTDARQLTTGPEPEVLSGTVEDDQGWVPDPARNRPDQDRQNEARQRGAA